MELPTEPPRFLFHDVQNLNRLRFIDTPLSFERPLLSYTSSAGQKNGLACFRHFSLLTGDQDFYVQELLYEIARTRCTHFSVYFFFHRAG